MDHAGATAHAVAQSCHRRTADVDAAHGDDSARDADQTAASAINSANGVAGVAGGRHRPYGPLGIWRCAGGRDRLRLTENRQQLHQRLHHSARPFDQNWRYRHHREPYRPNQQDDSALCRGARPGRHRSPHSKRGGDYLQRPQSYLQRQSGLRDDPAADRLPQRSRCSNQHTD